MQKLTCSSKLSEPSSCAVLGIPVLVFTGLHIVGASHTAAGSWGGQSQASFPFQPICLYWGRNTVCLFRWDISLPLELQVTVNVTQALFPVRKGGKNMPVNCLWCAANCQGRFNLVENYCALEELHRWWRFRAATPSRNERFVWFLQNQDWDWQPVAHSTGMNGLEGRLKEWLRLMGPYWDKKGTPVHGWRRAGQRFGVRLAGAGVKLSVSASTW